MALTMPKTKPYTQVHLYLEKTINDCILGIEEQTCGVTQLFYIPQKTKLRLQEVWYSFKETASTWKPNALTTTESYYWPRPVGQLF